MKNLYKYIIEIIAFTIPTVLGYLMGATKDWRLMIIILPLIYVLAKINVEIKNEK